MHLPEKAFLVLLHMPEGDVTFATLSQRLGWDGRSVIRALKGACTNGHLIQTMTGANRQSWTYAFTYRGKEKVLELMQQLHATVCLERIRDAVANGRPTPELARA